MADEQIVVRPAGRADVETLVAFNRAMAAETEGVALDVERLRAGTEAVFDDPSRGFYRIAEVDGRAAGMLLVTREWSDWRNGDFWWIQSVYVDPRFRRRGVYRAMHEQVVRDARAAANVCGVRLYVERANQRAKRTYESLGMAPGGYDMYEVDFVLGGEEK